MRKLLSREEYQAISDAMNAQPMPVLRRSNTIVFTDGQRVRYRGEFWYVFGVPHEGSVFVRVWDGAKDGCIQHVPADAVEDAPKPAPKQVKTKAAKPRVAKAPDEVVFLMREADSLDAMWALAERFIPYADELRGKVGHLNPGLQRMNIGNHIRKLWRAGEITLTQPQEDEHDDVKHTSVAKARTRKAGAGPARGASDSAGAARKRGAAAGSGALGRVPAVVPAGARAGTARNRSGGQPAPKNRARVKSK